MKLNGKKHGYRVYRGSNLGENPPVILFLHGYGESGTDNQRQLFTGIGKSLELQPERYPFLVIFPQKPDFELWINHTDLVRAICEGVERLDRPHPTKRYLTGLSQGGHGTFHLFDQLPWKFAAIAPICGWGEPMAVSNRIGNMPTWIFHGAFDPVVPASCSLAIFDCLSRFQEKPRPNARFTNFFGVDHNSWDLAYESDLPNWFLSLDGYEIPVETKVPKKKGGK